MIRIYCWILFIDTTKNIIKDDELTSMNEQNTLLYKNIPLSLYSRRGYTVCSKFEREMERHILREGEFFLPHIFLLEPGWANACTPCKPYRQRRPNASHRLRIPGSTLDSNWTDCLKLTVRFSYHMVSFRLHTCLTGQPRLTSIPLFKITTWQLVKAHGVTWNEPKIHINSHYITLLLTQGNSKKYCVSWKPI